MAAPPTAPEKVAEILSTYARTGNKSQTAELCGVGRDTVHKVVRRAEMAGSAPQPEPVTAAPQAAPASQSELLSMLAKLIQPAGVPPPPHVAASDPHPQPQPVADDPIAAERERIGRVRSLRQERELVKDIAGEQSLRACLEALIRDVVEPFTPPLVLTPPPIKGASQETVLICLSDWHAYEVVKRERVQGLNEYNAAVFARRAKRVITEAVKIKDRMEAGGGWRFPKCVVAANGDFVSGTIHEVERHSDAPDVIRAVYGCAVTLSLALRDLAANFEQVEVFCTSGNHGRLPDARKMQSKDPSRNWDTMIYLIAEAFLRDTPHVKFYIPDSYVCAYQIGSKTFVQYHGHSIKSWNSVPFYGIGRWTRNIQALRSKSGENVDAFLISHFHSDSEMPASSAKTFVNGSLIGGTEYSVNELGACDPPCQKMLLVSDPIGVNSSWSLYGEVEGEKSGPSYPICPWERG